MRSIFALLPLALLTAMLPGCNLLGVVAHKTLPPPRVPAEHALAEIPTAVVVEFDATVLGELGAIDAETLAVALERALRRQAGVEVVPEGLSRQRVVVWLEAPFEQGMLASDLQQGHARGSVRVVDGKGVEIWPATGGRGREVETQTPRIRNASAAEVRRVALGDLAVRIASLFHSREMRPEE